MFESCYFLLDHQLMHVEFTKELSLRSRLFSADVCLNKPLFQPDIQFVFNVKILKRTKIS